MEPARVDIFDSDQAFIQAASRVLLLVGGIVLSLVLLCKVFGLGLCDLQWVPIFGGFDVFREDLAAVNLPLAMIIIGVGLRLHSGFGWSTCIILLWVLASLFGFMCFWLYGQLDLYYFQVAGKQIQAADYPILESIAVNAGLAILCLLAIIYLMLPSVRRLYWQPKPHS
ncbi:MAG: hypothetical protein D6722_21745 [Bacteroidetes bacterium]|nr:MAG: hypothetical protein D6722_21745 [Bacteroidota bacterium]